MDEASAIHIGVLALMFGLGFLGVMFHWFRAALSQQAPWNLFEYLFVDTPGASRSMFVAYCAAMSGLYALGVFDAVKFEYISEAWENGYVYKPFARALIEVVGAGYLADSGFNKGGGAPKEERRATESETGEKQ